MSSTHSGVQKIQPKSGNRVAAGFLDILQWCERARRAVKPTTILASVKQCYMTPEAGPKFDVEPKVEEMQTEPKVKSKKKKVNVVKSKTVSKLERLALKKERKRKKIEREQRKKDQPLLGTPKKKATPKR